MNDKRIDIAMATDMNYEYMYIAIFSILQQISVHTKCYFHILVSEDFTAEAQETVMQLCETKGIWCSIKIYRIKDRFESAYIHIPRITTPTYYRLILPELLFDIDKCLYLDTDVLAMGDITELYNEDISQELIGGVYAVNYHIESDEIKQRRCKSMEISSMEQYVNAGVLLMNLKKMREDGFSGAAMELISHEFESQDQDIINKLCYGKIKKLPFRYNAMTKYYDWEKEQYGDCYSEKEVKEAWNDPLVIHYADHKKPWKYLDCPLANYWWNVCKQTDLWEAFYDRAADEIFHTCFYRNEKSLERGWRLVKNANHVLVYGAGKIGRKTVAVLEQNNIKIDHIVVTNIEENVSNIEGIQVIDLLELVRYPKSAVIVLGTQEKHHEEIINALETRGYINIITSLGIE